MALSRKSGTIPALAAYVGTIIGAGIFGVPYVLAQSGVFIGLLHFAVLGFILVCVNFYFADVVVAVAHQHRLPGFAGHTLGQTGKNIGSILSVLLGWFSSAVYIILGGKFLFLLLSPYLGGSEFIYQLIVAGACAIIVLGGLEWVAHWEVPLTALLLLVVLVITVAGVFEARLPALQTVDLARWFVPYGVILFAIGGYTVIPELEDIVGDGERKRLRRVIIIGMVLAVLLTAAFGAVVVGVSGGGTTEDAIAGLASHLGTWVLLVGALFGFLAVFTSFLTILMNQFEIFRYDYKLLPGIAWLMAVGVPVLLFLAGARNFIQMLGVTGGFLGGLGGIMIVAMYLGLLKKQGRLTRARVILPAVIGIVFLAGAITQISVLF